VPSTISPRSRPPSCSTPKRVSFGWSQETNRINWPVILATVFVSFTLVAGVLAWIATHPHKAAPLFQTTGDAIVELPAAPPAPPRSLVLSVAPVSHRSPAQEVVSRNIPLVERNSPPLPPPTSRPPKQDLSQTDRRDAASTELPLPKQPIGETYGTEVMFLNNRDAAADKARSEHKLLFVMHISGNFEDSCFT
jgi:hypothetical protein